MIIPSTCWLKTRAGLQRRLSPDGPLARWDVAVIISLVVLIYIVRAHDLIARPQFWAEDGSEFFTRSRLQGIESLVAPYAGYLHLVPRLVALVATAFSAVVAPSLYVTASLLLTIWSALTILTTEAPHRRSLALLIVLVPGSTEIFGSLTNIQWLLQPALLLLVIAPPPTSRPARHNGLWFALLAGLSGPFSALMAPLCLYGLHRSRRLNYAAAVRLIVILTGVVQLACVLVYPDNILPGFYSPHHILHTIFDQWFFQFISDRPIGILFFCISILVVAFAMRRFSTEECRLVAQLTVFALISLSAVFARYVHNVLYLDMGIGDRYFYMPRLVLMWIFAIGMFRYRRLTPVQWAMVLYLAFDFHHWERPPLTMLPWRSEAWRIDEGKAASIVINPYSDNTPESAVWRVNMPEMP